MLAELTTLNIISFLLIFFIGLPHGSFDGAVASLVGFRNKIQFVKFIFLRINFFFNIFIYDVLPAPSGPRKAINKYFLVTI